VKFNNCAKIGNLRIITGKKSPKRLTKPKASTNIPMIGHPIKTKNIPPKKHEEPLILCC